MKIYTVYMNKNADEPEENIEFIPEGFLVWAFVPFVNIFWAMQRRCWLFLTLIVLVYYVFEIYAKNSEILSASLFVEGLGWKFYMAFRLILLAFLGLQGYDFWRKKLEKQGYEMVDIISARDEIDAQRRFFDKRDGLTNT